MRRFTSATFVSFTRFFASFTSARNFAACATKASISLLNLKFHHNAASKKKKSAARLCGRSLLLLLFRPQPLRFHRRVLFRKRPHHVHQIPAQFFPGPIALAAGHFSPPIGNDVEQFAVRHLCQRLRIPPVLQFQFHVGGQVTLAVACFAVAHRAVITIQLLRLRSSLWSRLHGIFLCRVLRRNGSGRLARLWILAFARYRPRKSRRKSRRQPEDQHTRAEYNYSTHKVPLILKTL